MKHLPLKLPVLLLAATLISFAANAQRFDSVLNVLDSRYPQEKIYLHFDRSLYTPGETIWFKAYIFSGAFPSQISKTVYAELLDEQGKLLQRKSAPVFMSAAAAAFDLPADLKSSQVYVRAYTKWMLNFDQSFLFEKNIPIAVKRKSAGATAPTAYLQFFPEGGNLVSGLTSKIAFKATDGRGLPFNVKGDIVDGTGKKVNSFTSEHDGMGLFVLQPQPGQQYKAVWKDQAGKSQETALPQAQAAGLVME
ncbi:MAG TPA: hypothetical protein VD996_10450, partial [Chitinophagaceae bacterium]|nr:hypothetical protein [Chitinophagaceae bacterium]